MMAQAKQASDLHTSSLDQQALYFLLRDFDLHSPLSLLRREYYQRMNMMCDYLKRLDEFSFTAPKGGMFIWVKANVDLDMTVLLHEAVKHGVAYVPGSPFYVTDPQKNTFRLNFTHSTPEKIKQGMQCLSEVLRNAEKYKG